ncbi:hypothetical protein AVEN_253959-1 [Araneus ventricosus]|uniref:Uncharacterized protein n=1 Tax=Araneus ventricosus TaxID=182803 RepID=A0A4Y2VWT9_ARAVE|nr:hypothetical protein AVEN_253959-1 [Araneus ventricosus]
MMYSTFVALQKPLRKLLLSGGSSHRHSRNAWTHTVILPKKKSPSASGPFNSLPSPAFLRLSPRIRSSSMKSRTNENRSVLFSQQKNRFPTSPAVTSLPVTPLISPEPPLFDSPFEPSQRFGAGPEISSATVEISSAISIFLFSVTQQFPPGTMLRGETTIHYTFRNPPGAGSKKGKALNLLSFFIFWHKQILISHTQEFKTIKSLFK